MFQTGPGLDLCDPDPSHDDPPCATSPCPLPPAPDSPPHSATSSCADQRSACPSAAPTPADPGGDRPDLADQPAVIDSQCLQFERLSVNCDAPNAPLERSAAGTDGEEPSIGSDFPPIRLFSAEAIIFGEPTVSGLIILTRYRLIVLNRQQKRNRGQENGSGDGSGSDVPANGPNRSSEYRFSLPIGCLDSVECRDNHQLVILTKHVKSYVCTFHTADQTSLWFKRVNDAISYQSKLENLFCFALWKSAVACRAAKSAHHVRANGSSNGKASNGSCVISNGDLPSEKHENGSVNNSDSHSESNTSLAKDSKTGDLVKELASLVQHLEISSMFDEDRVGLAVHNSSADCLTMEFERMKFDDIPDKWRISDLNKDYKAIATYPQHLIVPQGVPDEHLKDVSSFRSFRRLASVVWRSQKNGCVIARSSQPEVGWFGWRSSADETMLDLLVKSSLNQHPAITFSSKKLLIVDARSYAAAVANRAKGGGCECPEYYPAAEVTFMGLANIHSIRKSFQSLRSICQSPVSDAGLWATQVDNTRWLHHISGLLKSALVVVNAVVKDERPVLVHCSDGWDRTPQITSLAELLLDPFYRTMDGFAILVQREWIEFGHKFSERCLNAPAVDDPNERCPVFLQWVDCVHQIMKQFPNAFEFNQQFLVCTFHFILSLSRLSASMTESRNSATRHG